MPKYIAVDYIDFKTPLPLAGEPTSYLYNKNNEKSPDFGSLYGQDIEPAGYYHTCNNKFTLTPNYTGGLIKYQNPIVIHCDETPLIWKKQLSERYSGLTGIALSNKIISEGFDGIITTGEYKRANGKILQHLGECISLGADVTEFQESLIAYISFDKKLRFFDKKWQRKLTEYVNVHPETKNWILNMDHKGEPSIIPRTQVAEHQKHSLTITSSDIKAFSRNMNSLRIE